MASILILAAGCRPAEPQRVDPQVMYSDYEDVARGSAETAGTYRLTNLDAKQLPAGISMLGRCRLYLSDGIIVLVQDGRYRLNLSVQEICGDRSRQEEEIVKEGFYSLIGSNLRFGDNMVMARTDPAPEVTTGRDEVVQAVIPTGRLAARGSLRAGRLTITLRDLRTLYFQREAEPGPPAVIQRGATAPEAAG
jgi:hypothetical protein